MRDVSDPADPVHGAKGRDLFRLRLWRCTSWSFESYSLISDLAIGHVLFDAAAGKSHEHGNSTWESSASCSLKGARGSQCLPSVPMCFERRSVEGRVGTRRSREAKDTFRKEWTSKRLTVFESSLVQTKVLGVTDVPKGTYRSLPRQGGQPHRCSCAYLPKVRGAWP